MTDLGLVWEFTRTRLSAATDGLSEPQAAWRPYSSAHSIAEHLVHIAGAEHYWAARLTGIEPRSNEFEAKLDRAVREGYLTGDEVPVGPGELSLEFALQCLAYTRSEIEPIFRSPTLEQLEREMESPVGDVVCGKEGLIRLAQHAGYHTGQIWLIKMSPDFPRH